MTPCLSHPHDACPCREKAFKNLLDAAKGGAEVIQFLLELFPDQNQNVGLNNGLKICSAKEKLLNSISECQRANNNAPTENVE